MKHKINRSLCLVILLGAMIPACDKDKEPAMLGRVCAKWTVTDVQFELTINGGSFAQFLVDNYGYSEADAQAAQETNESVYRSSWVGTMEFKKDGQYEFNTGGERLTNYWFLDDDEKSLHVYYINYYMIMDIESVDEHQLKLHWDQVYYSDLFGDGNKESIEYSNYFTLEK
jgi:hypothetical protein